MYDIHSSFRDCPLVDFTKSVTDPEIKTLFKIHCTAYIKKHAFHTNYI